MEFGKTIFTQMILKQAGLRETSKMRKSREDGESIISLLMIITILKKEIRLSSESQGLHGDDLNLLKKTSL